ncbi:MAG: hypothetical protein M3Q70_02825, partial [bacterium]|nr:hypothetical protein [bacterium]
MYAYVVFVVIYAALTLLPAPDPEAIIRYNLTPLSLRLLQMTIIIPVALIWYTALYGYSKLGIYNNLIKGTKDGIPVSNITKGIGFLTLSLPITSILGQILELWSRSNLTFTEEAVIITNYLNMVLPIAAFIFISNGASGLVHLARKRTSLKLANLTVLCGMFLGVAYFYLLIRAPGTIYESYYLPLGTVLFTLVLPYMFMWFLGLRAAGEIYLFSQKSAGVIYREAWRRLAIG